ncbi:F-box/LRR-repeat protein [Panicum miliaceum]|uniref:F-box/LRR-repeat protein n=1 Tax=Panicum miliaceum TaxID=4540 RepID=A0A3L6QI34_PANMI|nr:F-box/LRR-repeat protein [Panicum miliaceum]
MSLLWSSPRASSACRLILWQEYPCMPNSFFSTRVRISYTTVLKVLGYLEPAIHQLQIGGTVIEVVARLVGGGVHPQLEDAQRGGPRREPAREREPRCRRRQAQEANAALAWAAGAPSTGKPAVTPFLSHCRVRQLARPFLLMLVWWGGGGGWCGGSGGQASERKKTTEVEEDDWLPRVIETEGEEQSILL